MDSPVSLIPQLAGHLVAAGGKRLRPMLTLASARMFEIMPKPLLTRDQLRLLKYDNIPSGKFSTNTQIGMPSLKYFNIEVKKYCYMWKEGGQFSTEKYTSKENIKN